MKYRLIPLLLALLLLGGCGDSSQKRDKHTATVFAMDTVMDLTIYGGTQETLDTACQKINRLEALLSTTNEKSEIFTLNHTGTATLSPESAELLCRGLELSRETEGALALSIYPIVRAWGFTTGDYQVPGEETIAALLSHVDDSAISLKGYTAALPEGMEIDLGSIAKGYTGDLITGYFAETGITSALLNLGGNVQALGTKPDGSLWRVGVRDPRGEDYLGALEIADCAVVTSGGYERYFTDQQGNLYWHIMDPSTGKPAHSGLFSVTIVGQEGVRCDALSTALFIKGEAGAIEFWRTHGDFEMLLVTEDGRLLITPELNKVFTPTQGLSYEIEVIPC